MFLSFKVAHKEVFRNFRSLIGIFLFLGICFGGFFLISSFKKSTEGYILEKASELVAGDLLVSAYRDFEPAELEALAKTLPEAELSYTLDFRAMLSANGAVLFSSVRAIDEPFPLRGEIEIKRENSPEAESKVVDAAELSSAEIAWVYPQIVEQLGLKMGDYVQLGDQRFRVEGIIVDDPGSFQAGSGVSPRIYIGKKFSEQTKLLGVGSQVSHKKYYKFKTRQDVLGLVENLKERSATENLNYVTPKESVQNLKRFFGNFSQIFDSIVLFLSLLCALTSFYLFQSYFFSKLRNASIYLCFGLSQKRIFQVYLLEAAMIGLFGSLIACLTGYGLVVFLNQFVLPLLPGGFVMSLGVSDFVLVITSSLVLSLSFSIPILFRLRSIQLQSLLSGEGEVSGQGFGKSLALSLMGLSLFFFLSSAYLLESFLKASVFLGFVLFLWGSGFFVFRFFSKQLAPRLLKSFRGVSRIALLNLTNSRLSSQLCFLILLSLSFVFVVIGNFYFSFQNNIKGASEYDIPLVFLFNIPENELGELEDYVNSYEAVLKYKSPMILTRIKTKNDEKFEFDRVRQYPSRLSYREGLFPSETLVAGKLYSGTYREESGELPELSVAEFFFERYELKLGDVLGFDIQGVPVEGRVTSVRKVEWMSFQPNFSLQFQPGVLEEAPKTYVAALHSDNIEWPQQNLFGLVKRFPNLSVIDVNRTIIKVLEIVQKMSFSILILFAIGVLICFLILLSLVAHNLSGRKSEIKIFYLYGAAKQKLYQLFGFEFVYLSLIASSLAMILGEFFSWMIIQYMMEMKFSFSLILLCTAFFGSLILSFLISLVATRRVLNSSQELREAA